MTIHQTCGGISTMMTTSEIRTSDLREGMSVTDFAVAEANDYRVIQRITPRGNNTATIYFTDGTSTVAPLRRRWYVR